MNTRTPFKFFLRRLLGLEKRTAERHVCSGLVAYYWDGGTPIARCVRDMSFSGLYLSTADRWYVGTVITMTIQQMEKIDADHNRWIAVHARVVRQDSGGVGLAFVPGNSGAIAEMLMRVPQIHRGSMTLPKKLKDESGQAMVLALLSMTCLLGVVGFAADVGTLFYARRNLQIAADAAAIAGAAEINYSDMTTAADAAAAQNGVIIGTNGGGVQVNDPPKEGAYKGQAGYVEAIVWQNQPTFFMKIFHITSQTVAARAVATLGTGQGCIYTLAGTGADISVTGNADISVPKCGIIDDSSSTNALSLVGNATLAAGSIGIVGGTSETGNIHVSPTPVTGIAPDGNPLASLPAPTIPTSCSNSVNLTGNVTQTISQGCYSSISATGNVNLTLNSGTYIVEGAFGGFTGNVTITGSDVTLYLLGSTNLTGNVTLNLTAPTSGTYNGILIDEPSSNTNALSLTGNSGSTLEGIIYAPAASVTFTGNSGTNVYTDFVVGSLTLTGNSGFNDYAEIAGSTTPLTAVKLVE